MIALTWTLVATMPMEAANHHFSDVIRVQAQAAALSSAGATSEQVAAVVNAERSFMIAQLEARRTSSRLNAGERAAAYRSSMTSRLKTEGEIKQILGQVYAAYEVKNREEIDLQSAGRYYSPTGESNFLNERKALTQLSLSPEQIDQFDAARYVQNEELSAMTRATDGTLLTDMTDVKRAELAKILNGSWARAQAAFVAAMGPEKFDKYLKLMRDIAEEDFKSGQKAAP